MTDDDQPPNRVLFLAGLPGKYPLHIMKRHIHMLFSQHGRIVEVMPRLGKNHMTGILIFQELAEAIQAKQALDDKNAELFLRPKTAADLAAPIEHRPKLPSHATSTDSFTGNKTLFVENLPQDSNEESVNALFGQHPGFKEIRMVAGRPDIAFVEFDDESSAAVAKGAMNQYKADPTHELKVSFANR